MNIRMYNCYFGDCFKIENTSGNDLLVDFGIHATDTDIFHRTKRFDDIYSDVSGKNLDFLLSHYHDDHYNGVIYINDKYNYKFDDVYIPDIWNIGYNIQAVSLHLLRMILDRSTLNRGTTIFSFLKAICKNHSYVHFISRGSKIQDQYIALWPSEKFITISTDKIFEKIRVDYEVSASDMERLLYFSSELIKIVQDISDPEYSGEDIVSRIDSLEVEFWGEEFGFNRALPGMVVELRKYENNISIVFQNIKNIPNENLLFTGDFGNLKGLWDQIEMNYDSRPFCDMHSTYHAIKVGHHGTRGYYHSFAGRMNDDSNLLIPNGSNKPSWSICSDYSLNAITHNSKVVCSMDSSCEAKRNNIGNCTCTNNYIIGFSIYYDVT